MARSFPAGYRSVKNLRSCYGGGVRAMLHFFVVVVEDHPALVAARHVPRIGAILSDSIVGNLYDPPAHGALHEEHL